jgi:hypothetical protein
MRIALTALCLAGLACGADTKDPLATRCETVCQVDAASPCAGQKTKCIADCRALASDAQAKHGKACGECIADSFRYSVKPDCGTDPTCCWGPLSKSPGDPECRAGCVEPDAGAGY